MYYISLKTNRSIGLELGSTGFKSDALPYDPYGTQV